MNKAIVLCAFATVLVAAPAAASTMTVQTFVTKADSLKKKGPFALLSGDLKLLMNQVKADSAALRTERLAAKQAGRPQAFCPPEAGVKIDQKDIMAAMQAVPLAQRPSTETKAALRAYMARRFPCRG